MEKKTPLYDCHLAAGGKMIPFAGYLLPVQYGSGIITEHLAVRQQAGLFDVSHMGEVLYQGPDALANLNHLLTNDFSNLAEGKVRYSPMCDENGGVVDDLLVYKYHQEKYLVVVNASNRAKDVAWMQEHLFGQVEFTDLSDSLAELALQGPQAPEILRRLAAVEDIPDKYYSFREQVMVAGIPCLVSRTGYTGELGYELYVENAQAAALWQAVLAAGQDLGLIPCGLGARDTLRLEASMPLYGHEMDETITPLETGLGFAVKLDKADFIGKAALLAQGEPQRQRIGLKVVGRGIIRESAPLFLGEKQIGVTTSGTHCPYLGYAVAMALVERDAAPLGQQLEAEVRGKRITAEVIPLPFYKRA